MSRYDSISSDDLHLALQSVKSDFSKELDEAKAELRRALKGTDMDSVTIHPAALQATSRRLEAIETAVANLFDQVDRLAGMLETAFLESA